MFTFNTPEQNATLVTLAKKITVEEKEALGNFGAEMYGEGLIEGFLITIGGMLIGSAIGAIYNALEERKEQKEIDKAMNKMEQDMETVKYAGFHA